MKNFNAYLQPNGWRTTLQLVISLTFIIVWLPFIRVLFDGDTYQWGVDYFGIIFSGAGLSWSFLFLIAQLLLYVALIVGFFRMRNRKLYTVLLFIWWVNVFGNLLADIWINGDTRLQGDTLDINISLSWIVYILSSFAIFLIYKSAKSDLNTASSVTIPWRRKNQLMLNSFFISLPILFILLFFGEPHGLTDEIGVIFAMIQSFYLPFIFRPYN